MGQTERYQLRHAAGKYWLLDMEQSGAKSAGVVSFNESGAFIWEKYTGSGSEETAAREVSACYGIPYEDSLRDVRQFLLQLKQQGICFRSE